jgi:hypothetical protein
LSQAAATLPARLSQTACVQEAVRNKRQLVCTAGFHTHMEKRPSECQRKVSKQKVKKATKNANSYGKPKIHPTINKPFVNNPNGKLPRLITTILQRILDALVLNNTKYLTL